MCLEGPIQYRGPPILRRRSEPADAGVLIASPTMKNSLRATLALLASLAVWAAPAHAQNKAGDAAAGAKKNAACVGCHGIEGYQASFPEIYKVPKIGGQNAAYLVAALNAYKKGERKHPSMRGIAESLSEQDIADLAAYYAQQANAQAAVPEAPAKAPDAAIATKLQVCATCHGANFNKPIDASYPKLAGQYAEYLYVALKAYQTENNTRVGRANAIMASQAKPLSHAELKAIADYIGSLPSDMRTVPQSRFK